MGEYVLIRRALCTQNNCLHEIFFEQAFRRARELDEYLARKGKTVGPLHGLPVSLKDQFHVKGNGKLPTLSFEPGTGEHDPAIES